MAFAGASFGASASIRSKGTAAIVPPPALHLACHGSPVCVVHASPIAYPARRKHGAAGATMSLAMPGGATPFERSVTATRWPRTLADEGLGMLSTKTDQRQPCSARNGRPARRHQFSQARL